MRSSPGAATPPATIGNYHLGKVRTRIHDTRTAATTTAIANTHTRHGRVAPDARCWKLRQSQGWHSYAHGHSRRHQGTNPPALATSSRTASFSTRLHTHTQIINKRAILAKGRKDANKQFANIGREIRLLARCGHHRHITTCAPTAPSQQTTQAQPLERPMSTARTRSRLYEVIDTPSDIYIVMEAASGGELFDHVVAREKVPVRGHQ